MITHLQGLGLAATLLAVIVLVWRHKRLALGFAVLAAVQTVSLLRYDGKNPVPPDPDSPQRLRILEANVLFDNTHYDGLSRLIEEERPDVVAMLEFSPRWRDGLESLHDAYPYRYEVPWDQTGLALWFQRRPVRVDAPRRLVAGGWPVMHAIVEFAGRPRHLWLVHPFSPLKPQRRKAGNPELAAIAAKVSATGGSCIVFGDFNCTDGSPFFADFVRASGLRDSRLGFGRQPSWPSFSPYRIAIDHAFLTPDLAVASRRIGPEFGSDHLPLVFEVAVAAGAEPLPEAAPERSPAPELRPAEATAAPSAALAKAPGTSARKAATHTPQVSTVD
jgi:endonuclease/exonuclease/phosphatase (EEP) superfamily protein YafD